MLFKSLAQFNPIEHKLVKMPDSFNEQERQNCSLSFRSLVFDNEVLLRNKMLTCNITEHYSMLYFTFDVYSSGQIHTYTVKLPTSMKRDQKKMLQRLLGPVRRLVIKVNNKG